MDQREFTRVNLSVPVEIEFTEETVALKPIDVSAKGILLHSDGHDLNGREGVVRIFFTPDTILTAWGVVVRQFEERVALEFSAVELESFDFLKQYIRFHADDPDQVTREFDAHSGIRKRVV